MRRRVRTCERCGTIVPLEAIPLSRGRFYCPTGECKQEALRRIEEARERRGKEERCPFS